MIALIYFLGVILSFAMGRYTSKMIYKEESFEYDWNIVMFNILISFLSWFALISWIIIYFIEQNNFKTKIKVPKWL